MPKHRAAAQSYDPRSVQEHIVETPLDDEMRSSFLEYAYSVIYARALPDARDGLKPVQRRIIYQMGQMRLTPDKPYMKSARVVGEVMGKLHPHGDSAIYESMVRLAQPFAMELPLVDGHGNFGSLDDGPAASRYTEARLGPAALGMNADIDQDTVDFSPNYDNKLQEPDVLPAAIPNLLVNGGSGIAVGMATNLATHNLREVIAAAKVLLHNPEADLDEIMRYIPGPDWPSGGIIVGRDGIREAYETGRGTVTTRSQTHVENVTARKKAIVVTQLPYMVGPERVLERISDGVKNHKLDGISSAIDLTDRHNGTRIVIEIKTGFDPQAVLAALFKHTPLQDNFTMNNVALVNGRPHTMGLLEMLRVWIEHRRSVIERRSRYRRDKAMERLHLVEGLLLALIDIDEVIEVIRSSQDADAAKTRLMAVFDLDELQAQYILDLRLRRLTRMSRIELEAERDDLRKTIEQLERILASKEALDQVVEEEMDQVSEQYGQPRRTVLLDVAEDGSMHPVSSLTSSSSSRAHEAAAQAVRLSEAQADMAAAQAAARKAGESDVLAAALQMDDSPCSVVLTPQGSIARASHEIAEQLASSMPLRCCFNTTTLATYALITSAGRLVLAHVADLPVIHNAEQFAGVEANELLTTTEHSDPVEGEYVISAIAMTPAEVSEGVEVSVNDNGTTSLASTMPPLALGTQQGVVKRWNRETPSTMDSWSIIDLKDGDTLLGAYEALDSDRLVFISSDSSLLTFEAGNVRPQGRSAAGMAGIRLAEGASVLAFAAVSSDHLVWNYEEGEDGFTASGAVVLTVAGDVDALAGTDNGSAKITPLELYPTKGRATGGVRSQRFLKGQNTLIFASIGQYPLHAVNEHGHSVALPAPDMRRDGSGSELSSTIAYV